ncbi:MAG: hypothetical protein GY773_23640 [Actinomycetia bacterium]|nr:hypothetical protein [Actinomycetes bacterium]
MFDAIIFEKLGVPAVPIITKPFQPTAKAIGRLHGMADYTHVAVDHPITSLEDDELRERARLAAPEVEAALLAAKQLASAQDG